MLIARATLPGHQLLEELKSLSKAAEGGHIRYAIQTLPNDNVRAQVWGSIPAIETLRDDSPNQVWSILYERVPGHDLRKTIFLHEEDADTIQVILENMAISMENQGAHSAALDLGRLAHWIGSITVIPKPEWAEDFSNDEDEANGDSN